MRLEPIAPEIGSVGKSQPRVNHSTTTLPMKISITYSYAFCQVTIFLLINQNKSILLIFYDLFLDYRVILNSRGKNLSRHILKTP